MITGAYTINKNFTEPTNLADDNVQLQPRGRSAARSFSDSLDTMLGAVTQHYSFSQWKAGQMDKEAGLDFVTKEDLKPYLNQGLNLEFKENETPSQLKLRAKQYVKDRQRRAGINTKYQTTNMISSFIPELVNPVNFIPFGLAVKGLRTAGLLKKGAGKLNKANTAMHKGQMFRAIAHESTDLFKNALIFNTAIEPLYYMDATAKGNNYTVLNSLTNIAIGTAVGTTLFAPIIAGLRIRASNRMTERGQMFTDMYEMIRRGETTNAANFAYKNSKEFRKRLQKQEEMITTLENKSKGDASKLDYKSLPIREKKVVRDTLYSYYADAFQARLAKAISKEIELTVKKSPNKNGIDVVNNARKQYIKIFDAFQGGNYKGLKAPDLKILKRFAKDFAQELGIKGDVFTFNKKSFRDLRTLFDNASDATRNVLSDVVKATSFAKHNINRIKDRSEPISVRQLTQNYLDRHKKANDSDSANQELKEIRFNSLHERLKSLTNNPKFNKTKQIIDLISAAVTDAQILGARTLSFTEFKSQIKEFLGEVREEGLEVFDATKIGEDSILQTNTYLNLYKMYNQNVLLKRNKTLDSFKAVPELYRAILKSDMHRNQGFIDLKMVDTYTQAKVMDELNNALKITQIKNELNKLKTDKAKAQYLRSLIDGQERKGIPRLFGIENITDARAIKEFGPILQVLDEYGLFDIFFATKDPQFLRPFRNRRKDLESYTMFGRNRAEASRVFHAELHQGLINRKLPEQWKGEEGLEILFDLLQSIEMKLLRDLNNSGIDVNFRQDFGGISQKWDVGIIYTMGREAFIKKLLPRIDIAKTAQAHGGVLFVDGKPQQFGIMEFMNMWYKSLDPAKRTTDDVKMFRTDEIFGGRNVIIRPEYATQTMLDFSGYDNIGHLLFNQLNQRVKFLTMTEMFGTKPSDFLRTLADDIGNSRDKRELQTLIKYVTGLTSNPKSIPLATLGKNIQKASHILFLGLSGPTTLLDIPQIAGTLKYQGMNIGENSVLFAKVIKDAYNRKYVSDPAAMSAWFATNGSGLSIILNSYTKRLGDDVAGKRGLLDKGADFAFKFNQMMPMTNVHEEIALDLITRLFAMELKSAKIDSVFMRNLTDFGFTQSDITKMRKGIVRTADGVERISWDSVGDSRLSDRLVAYQQYHMKQAVIRPDIGSNAQMTFGTRRGTPAGEMVAIATQYMNFPLQLTKVMYRRFLNGNYGQGLDSRMAYILGWYASMLSMAYVVTLIKDIIKGKDPINLLNMSSFDMGRIVRQSGILPIGAQEAANVIDFGPTAVVAPIPAAFLELFNAETRPQAMRDLSGQNIPFVGQGVNVAYDTLIDPLFERTGMSIIGVTTGEGINSIESGILEDLIQNRRMIEAYDYR